MKYFYNFCLKDDDTALDSDILSGVRRGYFSDFQKIKDRITVNSDSDSVSYEYTIEKDKPMKWEVTKDKTILQDVNPSDGGKYFIYFYKDERLYKRILFSRLHTLLRVEYFDVPTGLQMISLEPRKAQRGICILYDSRITPQPIVLYPVTMPEDERLMQMVEDGFEDYTVRAATDEGIVLFLSDEQERAYREFIDKAQKELDENREESFVGDSTPLYDNIKAKDFNVKRNLATSLDITKAPEFSYAPEPEIPAEDKAAVEEEADAVAVAAAAAISEALGAAQQHEEELIAEEAVETEAEATVMDNAPDDVVVPVPPQEDTAESEPSEAAEITEPEPAPVEDEPEAAPAEEEAESEIAEPASEFSVKPDKLIMADGAVYSYFGELDENGNRSGYGRTLTDEGRTAYEGRYLNDKRSGNGSYYYKDGTLCYTGDWVENARHGVGVGVRSGDGSIHVGRWALNKPQGDGVRLSSDGDIKFVCKELNDGSTVLMNYMPDDTVVVAKYDAKGKKLGEKTISLKDIPDNE